MAAPTINPAGLREEYERAEDRRVDAAAVERAGSSGGSRRTARTTWPRPRRPTPSTPTRRRWPPSREAVGDERATHPGACRSVGGRVDGAGVRRGSAAAGAAGQDAGAAVGVSREHRRLVRMLRPPPVHRPSVARAVAGWVWRHLPELLLVVLLVRFWAWASPRIGPQWTVAAIAALGLAVFGWPVSRRAVLAVGWCAVTRHRLHTALVEVRATTRDGRLPLFLAVMPAPFGERVRLWCRAGISAEDLADESDRLRAALWARDVRVTRDRRWSALVVVDVVRRDPLADGRPIRSALLDHLDTTGGVRL